MPSKPPICSIMGGRSLFINKLGVSENSGRLPEKMFDCVCLLFYLLDEFVFGIQEAQAMVIGFTQELDAAGIGELPEGGNNLGGKFFQLLKAILRLCCRKFEFAFVLFLSAPALNGWPADSICPRLSADLGVFVVVKIIRLIVENVIVSKPVGLMHLK